MTRYIEAARNRGFCAGRAILAGNPPAPSHRAAAIDYAKRVAIAENELGEKSRWLKSHERTALAAYESARQLWQFDR